MTVLVTRGAGFIIDNGLDKTIAWYKKVYDYN
jgi:hypothetical protein